MADEVTEVTESTPSNDRINQLSDKVKNEGIRADTAVAEAAEAKKQAAFANGYADMLGTYPAAKEFKADIEAKAMAGYSVEDATLAVLAKAGRIGTPPTPVADIAGGSATTVMSQTTASKPVSEMSTAEKREALSGISPVEAFSAFRANN